MGFSGPSVSSANKTDRHDIIEILLKVALSTIKQTNKQANKQTNKKQKIEQDEPIKPVGGPICSSRVCSSFSTGGIRR